MHLKRQKISKRKPSKLVSAVLLLSLLLFLTSCGKAGQPQKTSDGNPWNNEWTTFGSMLGVEVPDGYTEQRSEGIVTSSQTYYTVWSMGEALTYTNKDENEVTTYDAQIHLLAEDAKNEDTAAQDAATWQSISDERYEYSSKYSKDFGDQTFTICVYEFPEDGGPASRGASANAIRSNWAFHVDVILTDDQDPQAVLENFLRGFHYAR